MQDPELTEFTKNNNLRINLISGEEVKENLINQIKATGEIIGALCLTTNN